MKISIITPVRNAALTLPATLASVAAQDHPEIEHIVVDGASSDGTLDIIRRAGTPVLRVLSEPDRGVYDACNKGLALATGDVVAFLGAGDVYEGRDVLRRIAVRFGQPGIEAVFGDLLILDEHHPHRMRRRYRSSRSPVSRFAWGLCPAHPSLFVLRGTYARCGGFNPGYRIAGDFEFCIRLFAGLKIQYTYLPEVLVRMQRGGLSDSGWRSKWTSTMEMRRACESNNIRTSYPQLLSRLPIKLLEYVRVAD